MSLPKHNLDTLETRRLTLEDNILQLQKSLYHWRNWEAEYDSLQHEIRNLEDDATTDEILSVGREYGGPLVNEEEMQKIVTNQGAPRSRTQVVDLLGRRIDYVKQNAATIEKRLRAAQDELYASDAQDRPPAEGGTDFPMREIFEELDEEGNIISSSVKAPGNQASDLLETLKKAGVSNIPDQAGAGESRKASSSVPTKDADTPQQSDQSRAVSEDKKTTQQSNSTSQSDELDLSQPVSLVTPEDRQQPPVTDVDESPEDARLRREMLQYGIDEVGAIVAELEMDEEGSDISVGEDDYIDTDDEEEDEFGRSHTVLSEEYHQQMRDLEAKLNARGMWNMGKDSQTLPEEVQEEITSPAVRELGLAENGFSASTKDKKPKKRVAFADDLDIAPTSEAPAAGKATETRTLPPKADVPVLSDSIVERTEQAPEPRPTGADAPKKVSRFKSARSATEPTGETTHEPAPPKLSKFAQSRKQANAVPSATPLPLFPAKPDEPKPFSTPIIDTPNPSVPQPPEGRTLADKLVERETSSKTAVAPEPDELNDEIYSREIASEFYKMRNRMIQNNGGFVNNEERAIEPIEPEDPRERVSKFKAARMR